MTMYDVGMFLFLTIGLVIGVGGVTLLISGIASYFAIRK